MKTYSTTSIRIIKATLLWPVVCLFIGLAACSQTSQPINGPTQRLRVMVGEIKEVSLPAQGDGRTELIGTSDNQEVVEVSRQQLAPAVDTLSRSKSGPTVFQIKGVTSGTANVVFSARPLNQSGNGQPVRTYVVRVVAK
ncbi:hypothetical protein [Spirosoma profusum]|uniref:hypothetical protein n=1 Tax=Spirosoma profusum TaxID=2771354 RepID=UPI001CC25033|nr:hypothetical protein [Spirosoma profusum]